VWIILVNIGNRVIMQEKLTWTRLKVGGKFGIKVIYVVNKPQVWNNLLSSFVLVHQTTIALRGRGGRRNPPNSPILNFRPK